jgi:hypothetical protein
VYGRSTFTPTLALQLLNSNTGIILTNDLNGFGYGISSIGDFNNDGFDDIAVGAM